MAEALQKERFESMFDLKQLDTVGDEWGHRWRASQQFRLNRFFELYAHELARLQTGAKILDIGCGQGDFILRINSRFPHLRISGSDISSNVTEWNKQNIPGIHFFQQALPEVGCENNSLDGIVCLEVFSCLSRADQEESLKRMSKSLRRGGWLAITSNLDDGSFYTTEEDFRRLLCSEFHIEWVEYHYGKLYNRIERPFLRLYRFLNRVRNRNDFWKIPAEALIPGFRLFLSQTWLACFFAKCSQAVLKKSGRSHIVALVRKPE